MTDEPVISQDASRFAQAVFLGFLLLVFVGLKPFQPPAPEVGTFGAQGMTGSGDIWRQLAYILAFAVILFAALRRRGLAAPLDVPTMLLLLMLWSLLSALWAADAGVAVRRAGLATIVLFCTFLSVQSLPAERAMVLWRAVLLAILLVNLVSIRFVPLAVHQMGEADPALVGNWRGLYGHKNIAGQVGAMTALLFLFAPRKGAGWMKLFDLAVVGLALAFVVGTRSKSSLGLLFVSAFAGLIYQVAWRRALDRAIAVVAVSIVAALGAVLLIADADAITRLISDPTEFTGRTEIWKAEIAYILDHPLLGAGFGSFADTGKLSPLYAYAPSWVSGVSHGHNGYLQILTTLGGVGFALALVGLIVRPVIAFWRRDDDDIGGGFASDGEARPRMKPALFALFVFLLLHNLMESDFLEADGTAWVTYLMMLALLIPRKEAA